MAITKEEKYEEILKKYKAISYKKGIKKIIADELELQFKYIDNYWFKKYTNGKKFINEKYYDRILELLDKQLEKDRQVAEIENKPLKAF